MATVEQTYRYLQPSAVVSADGRADLLLATSGGYAGAGDTDHPRFFRGFLGHPEQAAAAMLTCARVARTRFYTPPNMVAAKIRAADPVVTSNGDRLRFESFSACCGVYSRFDVLPESLDIPPITTGTTNVDFNAEMRELLAGVRDLEPLHLEVGTDVAVTTLDANVVERKVPLPERWLKGFAEVQLSSAGMKPRSELSGIEARRFLRSLPASSRRPLWVVPAGRTLRLTTRPNPEAVCVAGVERLRALEPLLRFVTSLRVYGPPVTAFTDSAASAWELSLHDARMTIVLSPDLSRGFSGEGGVLLDMSDDRTADDADLVSLLLAWEPRIDIGRLATEGGITPERVISALARLGSAGRVGYDLAEDGYFHRELPYDPAALARLHPRLRDAQDLLDRGAVLIEDGGVTVVSGGVAYRVTLAADGDKCTCPWWGKYRGARGPCKHVLAATMATR